MKYIAKQLDFSGNNICIHMFTMPDYGEKRWYRQGISLSAFRHGKQKSVPKKARETHRDTCCWDWNNGFLYIVSEKKDEHREHMRTVNALNKVKEGMGEEYDKNYKELEIKEWDSLYSFYKAIGFDRHKRKYI